MRDRGLAVGGVHCLLGSNETDCLDLPVKYQDTRAVDWQVLACINGSSRSCEVTLAPLPPGEHFETPVRRPEACDEMEFLHSHRGF